MTTTPTTPEYHRRVIAPTAKAIQYSDRLADLMIEIHQTYTPLIAASIAAVESGNGFEVAEQIIADVEYMATPVTAWMTSAGIRNNGAFDGISEAVMGGRRVRAAR